MNIETMMVKCGDCNVIHGISGSLLIDCGSDNSDGTLSSNEFAYSKIANYIRDRKISYILISHFHKDHFNGILSIPDDYRVQKTYLPYSIIDGRSLFTDGLTRLLAIAPPRSWGFQLSKRIVELFKKLDHISGRIEFLKKNDSIQFENIHIRILWPEITLSAFDYGSLPVKIAIDTPTMDDREEYKHTEIYGHEMNYSVIEERLERVFDELTGDDNQELQSAASYFHEKIDTYLRRIHDGEEVSFEPIYENYRSLLWQHNHFIQELHPEKFNRVKYFARQQYHSLVTSMNAISIVCDCDDKFLFLGDAPSCVVDYLHNKSLLKDWYQFVKIQHHGTPSHFTINTPKGSNNVISNGGYIYRKVCEKYQGHVPILCTNAHEQPKDFCQLYRRYRTCPIDCIRMYGSRGTPI